VKDLRATGWTVDSGTTPEPFSATVLGRLTDGIAPGVDLIMARLSSPALTAAGGVWAGMSGSPVYTSDGRLVGSVSYTLAPNTMVAGITPAQQLGTLLSADPDDPRRVAGGRARIRPDAATVAALQAAGVARAQATQGFSRLPVPVTVSGATSPGARPVLQRLERHIGQRVVSGGSAARGTAAASAISGGSNFAAALSSGDASVTAVGTTTYTCKGRVVAFGHLLFGSGLTVMAASAATAVYVQPDALAGPSKMANVGGAVGTIDRDRPIGVRARLGAAPPSIAISSRLTRVETKTARTGRTTVFYPLVVAETAGLHALTNVDLVQGSFVAKGTGRITLTVTGRRAGGRSFTLTRSDVLTAPTDAEALDLEVSDQVGSTVMALRDQPFEDVTFQEVRLTGSVSSRASLWTRPVVEVRQGSQWVRASRAVVVRAGTTLRTRVRFTRLRAPAVHGTLEVALPVPKAAARQPVELTVTGGLGDLDEGGPTAEATSFDALLTQLRTAPRGDDVAVKLVNSDNNRVYVARTRQASLGVEGFTQSFPASVR